MRELLNHLAVMMGIREEDESASREITPQERVRALRAKGEPDKFRQVEISTVSAKHGTCDDCAKPLELSLFYGIKYCPNCAEISDPKNVRFERHLLVSVFWGAIAAIAFSLFIGNPEGLGVFAVSWAISSLIILVLSYVSDWSGGDGGCGGCGGCGG